MCVGDKWRRIIRWLNVHAPVTAARVRGPAEGAVVDAIARDVGAVLPADLRDWWALTDGYPPGAVGRSVRGAGPRPGTPAPGSGQSSSWYARSSRRTR
jgi:hypothetical protein